MSPSVTQILLLLCAFLCGQIVIIAVPSVCGAILGLLLGAVIRAIRKEGGNPTILSAAVRAVAISVPLGLLALFLEAIRQSGLPTRMGGFVLLTALVFGFALNVLLALASVVWRPAPNGRRNAVDAGIVPCAFLAFVGFAIGVVFLAVLAEVAARGLDFISPERLINRLPNKTWRVTGLFAVPMACSLIGGLVGFLLSFRRSRLRPLPDSREETPPGDDGGGGQ